MSDQENGLRVLRKAWVACWSGLEQFWECLISTRRPHVESESRIWDHFSTGWLPLTHFFPRKLLGFELFIFAVIWGWPNRDPFSSFALHCLLRHNYLLPLRSSRARSIILLRAHLLTDPTLSFTHTKVMLLNRAHAARGKWGITGRPPSFQARHVNRNTLEGEWRN